MIAGGTVVRKGATKAMTMTNARIKAAAILVVLTTMATMMMTATAFAPISTSTPHNIKHHGALSASASKAATGADTDADAKVDGDLESLFNDFASFLETKQTEIIEKIESIDGSGEQFCRDTWGIFDHDDDNETSGSGSGGITRVIQGGAVVEKGACSLTLLRGGKLTADRAASIRGRQNQNQNQNNEVEIQEGDEYNAAALSIVLHTRSPMVPTFRSDVRIFMVRPQSRLSSSSSKEGDGNGAGETLAWFGGGADLTPYYLFDEDATFFHSKMRDLCEAHSGSDSDSSMTMIDYLTMKRACDDYFYIPARSEHRGIGGIFFDDLPATSHTQSFVRGVVDSWMPSWTPIVTRRQSLPYTDRQKQWQLLRRGRYLEFNLLADRGVKFGLAQANPRVEGVMVSAPPLIAWEYNHRVEEGSEEERLMKILKEPIEWV